MQKYKVKTDCEIWHEDKQYKAGKEVELTPELALHHAANIETVNEKRSEVRGQKSEKDTRPLTPNP